MIISRGEILARLTEASVGLSSKEVLEQSNAFVFKDDQLITFNDRVMVRLKNPLDFNAVVDAAVLLGILGKIPDDEVDITIRNDEIRIKGKRRTAGIPCSVDVHLPITAVPPPGKWSRITDGTPTMLQQAARTCGQDETQYLSTCVHITPDRVEACDNYRLFRVDGPTGFPEEVLIPASSIGVLEELDITKVSMGKGWVHFKTQSGAEISVRCSHETYHKGVDELLVMTDAEKVLLPSNLKDIVERAEVFTSAQYDARMTISIDDNELTLTSRKESGWYRERKKIKYEGRPLSFDINPKFLVDILARTREVSVSHRKIKIVTDRIHFVVSLAMKVEKREEEEEAPTKQRDKDESDNKYDEPIPF